MKITECYPDYVFTRLGAKKNVDAVDFKRLLYIDLDGQTVGAVQLLIDRAKTEGLIKFYQFDEDEN